MASDCEDDFMQHSYEILWEPNSKKWFKFIQTAMGT